MYRVFIIIPGFTIINVLVIHINICLIQNKDNTLYKFILIDKIEGKKTSGYFIGLCFTKSNYISRKGVIILR